MSERSIIEAAARLRNAGEEFLIATVMCVHGSSYRRPGARMLLTRDRWVAGSVSGGCIESDVARKCWWLTEKGEPAIVSYGARHEVSDDDTDAVADDEPAEDLRAGFGLGCDGVIDVLLERIGASTRRDPLAFIERCVADQRRGALATVFRSSVPALAPIGTRVAVCLRDGTLAIESDPIDEKLQTKIIANARAAVTRGTSEVRRYDLHGASVEVLVEAIVPPPRLFVLGGGHDAVAVVQLAKTLGWDVIVCATQIRMGIRERFATLADELVFGDLRDLAPRLATSHAAAAVVMSHHYEHDRAALAMLLDSDVRYLGMLGPRRRTARMLAELGLGNSRLDDRLHAPIGLNIGAETPQEIALAIVAEVQAVLARASADSLRASAGPIHAAIGLEERAAMG